MTNPFTEAGSKAHINALKASFYKANRNNKKKLLASLKLRTDLHKQSWGENLFPRGLKQF